MQLAHTLGQLGKNKSTAMDNTKLYYYLSAHTFLCLVDNHFVFLDLRNDKYLCLDREKSDVLQRLLNDEPAADPLIRESTVAADKERSQLVDLLLERGLLTRNPTEGKAIAAVTPCTPVADLKSMDPDEKPTVRVVDIVRFVKASIFSAARLRWLPLERVIRRVEKKKQRFKSKNNLSSTHLQPKASARQIEEKVQIFNHLRPLLYSAKNQCLYDALVLVEFLRGYGIYPDWVFGVKMGPFSAHCWVQNGDIVFNDSVAHTAFHTPIMVV